MESARQDGRDRKRFGSVRSEALGRRGFVSKGEVGKVWLRWVRSGRRGGCVSVLQTSAWRRWVWCNWAGQARLIRYRAVRH